MTRFPTLIAATFAVLVTAASYAQAAPAVSEIAGDLGRPLTLTSAKHMVSAQLATSGQRSLQPGHAEFDSDGNVHVDIVSSQGLTVSHVIVHANNGMITDANVGKKGARG